MEFERYRAVKMAEAFVKRTDGDLKKADIATGQHGMVLYQHPKLRSLIDPSGEGVLGVVRVVGAAGIIGVIGVSCKRRQYAENTVPPGRQEVGSIVQSKRYPSSIFQVQLIPATK